MKISAEWLKSLTQLSCSPQDIEYKFNGAGLEVEAVVKDADESVMEISLTPNRGDCLSALGLARELSALYDKRFEAAPIQALPAKIADKRNVILKDKIACPLYAGRVIKNIKINQATPDFILKRLQQNGTRSINVVVDITNYVLLELGQPMHAFDLDQFQGDVVVRFAEAEETLTLLDEQTVTLSAKTLVIADERGPQAIAGVMGGLAASTSEKTQSIFLESAYFKPESVAGIARSYGLVTDSAYRFERGVDPALAQVAIERASALIIAHAGGELGPVHVVQEPSALPAIKPILLTAEKLKRLCGFSLPIQQAEAKLHALGFEILERTAQSLKVKAPSYRFDIAIEADLIEEVLRLVGFDAIPEGGLDSGLHFSVPKANVKHIFARHLLARAYSEIISFSFIAAEEAQSFSDNPLLVLQNPISPELSVMRPALMPSLLKMLAYNQHRQQTNMKLFTEGTCFSGLDKNIKETTHIAAVATGLRHAAHFDATQSVLVDFLDIKGEVESILANLFQIAQIDFIPKQIKGYHPNQCAEITYENKVLGCVGQIHPDVLKRCDIKNPVFGFELDMSQLSLKNKKSLKPLPKFPEVRRDIAILVSSEIESAALIRAMQVTPLLQSVQLIDMYQGKGIPSGQKSLAFALHFQLHERTLTDEEVNAAQKAILTLLYEQFGATLRE